jgi:peptide/nickel transport system permease protein
MVRTLTRQAGGAAATLLALSVITFAATNLKSPEDVARGALGRYVTEAQLAAYVEERGLDEPLHVRYVNWLGDFMQGDLGISPVTNRPVADDLFPRLRNTLILAACALLIAVPLSFFLAAFVALRPRTRRDTAFVVGTVVMASLPEFVVGILVVLVFGVWLQVLPIDSTGLEFGGFATSVEAYIPPMLALVLVIIPQISRIGRATFREVFASPYFQAAALRGLERRTLVWRHALPNASVVLVHVVALNVIFVLGGVLVIENVFAFPGVGQLLVDAVRNGDAVMLQAGILITGGMFILVSLLADFLAAMCNPKLRTAA